jgi:hypothetical protein
MSDRVKVGTSKVTFRVRAFDYPQIELASVEVDVPMYTKTDNKLDNMQQGHVTADVPDGFNEKVKDALQVFADTLQASFNEEGWCSTRPTCAMRGKRATWRRNTVASTKRRGKLTSRPCSASASAS